MICFLYVLIATFLLSIVITAPCFVLSGNQILFCKFISNRVSKAMLLVLKIFSQCRYFIGLFQLMALLHWTFLVNDIITLDIFSQCYYYIGHFQSMTLLHWTFSVNDMITLDIFSQWHYYFENFQSMTLLHCTFSVNDIITLDIFSQIEWHYYIGHFQSTKQCLGLSNSRWIGNVFRLFSWKNTLHCHNVHIQL